MKGSMATDNFVVRLAFPIMGMLLIGRKAVICVGGRRCTRRSGWRGTDVGFMTSAAAEDMHNVRRAIFAARGACCVCRMAAIGVVRYGLLVKTTGAAS